MRGMGGLGVYSLAKHAFSMRARTACGSALAAEYTTPYAKYTQSPRTSLGAAHRGAVAVVPMRCTVGWWTHSTGTPSTLCYSATTAQSAPLVLAVGRLDSYSAYGFSGGWWMLKYSGRQHSPPLSQLYLSYRWIVHTTPKGKPSASTAQLPRAFAPWVQLCVGVDCA